MLLIRFDSVCVVIVAYFEPKIAFFCLKISFRDHFSGLHRFYIDQEIGAKSNRK